MENSAQELSSFEKIVILLECKELIIDGKSQGLCLLIRDIWQNLFTNRLDFVHHSISFELIPEFKIAYRNKTKSWEDPDRIVVIDEILNQIKL